MKKQLLLLLFILAVSFLNAQQTVLFNTMTGQVEKSKKFSVNGDSVHNRLIILLPDTDFENVRIRINEIELGFYNRSKKPAKNFIPLYAQDISSGQIVLKFKGNQLLAIGNRVLPNMYFILDGKDVVTVWKRAATSKQTPDISGALDFSNTGEGEEAAEKPGAKNPYYTSKYCQYKQDTLPVPYLIGKSFLCDEKKGKDSASCYCAPALSDPNNKIYLQPCYDATGNAVSASNHILIDTRPATNPLFKVSLYQLQKGKDTCVKGRPAAFEFGRKLKKMNLQEGTLVPITVIAHKDSMIIIDSNYSNYFLDSAKAVETNYAGTGEKSAATAENKTDSLTPAVEDTKRLRGTVNLRNDLMTFNSIFENNEFVLIYYRKQLLCLQRNIVEFYGLPFIPATGNDLAEAIDNTIAPETAKKYAQFLCSALRVIAEEYDKALKHTSDYRQYTQYFQVPNADEITFKVRTKNSTAQLFGQTFLIKGGWKIDFSTGVFVSGLNNRDFIHVSRRLAYRDSVNGPLKDTTNHFLDANKGKLNFSTGFLVHLYKRSGDYFNWGAVTGITINDDDFKLLLGGSAMFRMGNGRLAFVAGAAVGKQKQLDANQQQFNIRNVELPPNKVYIQTDPVNKLPRFFTETNISTYDKLKLSWFAGITYNFAGLSLGK